MPGNPKNHWDCQSGFSMAQTSLLKPNQQCQSNDHMKMVKLLIAENADIYFTFIVHCLL